MSWKFWRKQKNTAMDFRRGLELADLPIVTFYQGDIKLNFLLDTGANYSVINSSTLNSINYTPSKHTSTVYGLEGKSQKASFAIIEFTYRNNKYDDSFQVIDMSNAFDNIKKESGVTLHGIIGNSFMQRFKYVLDFDEMIAYSKSV